MTALIHCEIEVTCSRRSARDLFLRVLQEQLREADTASWLNEHITQKGQAQSASGMQPVAHHRDIGSDSTAADRIPIHIKDRATDGCARRCDKSVALQGSILRQMQHRRTRHPMTIGFATTIALMINQSIAHRTREDEVFIQSSAPESAKVKEAIFLKSDRSVIIGLAGNRTPDIRPSARSAFVANGMFRIGELLQASHSMARTEVFHDLIDKAMSRKPAGLHQRAINRRKATFKILGVATVFNGSKEIPIEVRIVTSASRIRKCQSNARLIFIATQDILSDFSESERLKVSCPLHLQIISIQRKCQSAGGAVVIVAHFETLHASHKTNILCKTSQRFHRDRIARTSHTNQGEGGGACGEIIPHRQIDNQSGSIIVAAIDGNTGRHGKPIKVAIQIHTQRGFGIEGESLKSADGNAIRASDRIITEIQPPPFTDNDGISACTEFRFAIRDDQRASRVHIHGFCASGESSAKVEASFHCSAVHIDGCGATQGKFGIDNLIGFHLTAIEIDDPILGTRTSNDANRR